MFASVLECERMEGGLSVLLEACAGKIAVRRSCPCGRANSEERTDTSGGG